MKKSIYPLLVLGLCLLVTNGIYGQHVFYASPNGSGDDCTLSSPGSLSSVRDKVRTMNSNMDSNIVVNLLGGIYNLDAPFVLGPDDSGSNGYNVIYQANDTLNPPIFSGGKPISGWELHDAKRNIYRAYVGDREFRQLYVDEVPTHRARTPNKESYGDRGPYYGGITVDAQKSTVKISKHYIEKWERLNQVEMVLIPHWYHHRILINSFTTDNNYATIQAQLFSDKIFNKTNYWYGVGVFYFENAYEFLDVEGEWYLNTDNDSVYYIPRKNEDMNIANVMAPYKSENLLIISGDTSNFAQNIQVIGIQFEYTNWLYPSKYGLTITQGNQIIYNLQTGYRLPQPAVKVDSAKNILFKRNVFSKLGGTGIDFQKGVQNSQIIGNSFFDISGNGMVIGSSLPKIQPDSVRVANITVANNFITRIGADYTNAQGILAGFVNDVIIEHNEITNTGYSGMQIGQQPGGNIDVDCGNNLIRYNNIYDVVQVHDDGGGIYTLGRQRGTHIFENWLHHIQKGAWAASYPVAAEYQDNYSEFITIERNVMHDNSRDIYEQVNIGAQNNTYIDNNIQDQSVKDNAGIRPRFKYVKDGIPTLPPLPKTKLPELSGDTIQIEDMHLIGAIPDSLSIYSNKKGVKPVMGTGQAIFVFTGESGTYNIEIAYIKENDGNAKHSFYVNNSSVHSWIATRSSSALELAFREIQSTLLNKYDTIKITGQRNKGSDGRMDYIIFREKSASLAKKQVSDIHLQVYPNPADDLAIFDFHIKESTYGNIAIYDIAGKEVVRTEDRLFTAGQNMIQIGLTPNGIPLSRGIYIYKLELNGMTTIGKLIIGNSY